MSKFVVVGGGLSGLSAALFLKLQNMKNVVKVLESSERLGGWIKSKKFQDGSVHELGPRTIRMQSKTVNYLLKIIDNINVSNEIISISKQNKTFHKRYIFAHNKLNLLNFDVLKPAQSPFSDSIFMTLLKASQKKFVHKDQFEDLSVDDFVRTRFGHEMADYVANPMIRGIYACDSKDVSIRSIAPFLLDMERSSKNIVFGMIKYGVKNYFQSSQETFQNKKLNSYLIDSTVLSFNGGLETLIESIKSRLTEIGVEIETESPVQSIERTAANQIRVQLTNRNDDCDKVILAVPSFVSSKLLSPIVPNADLLSKIHWNSVAVVVLEYRGRLIPYSGFGHLIPSWEIEDTLGVIYDSCILPENDSRESVTTRYTVMFGGAWFQPNIGSLSNSELVDKAMGVLMQQIGVEGELMRSTVGVHDKCIPVYDMMHKGLVNKARESIKERELPISLCGNSYDGVSLSDCVYSAYQAAMSK